MKKGPLRPCFSAPSCSSAAALICATSASVACTSMKPSRELPPRMQFMALQRCQGLPPVLVRKPAVRAPHTPHYGLLTLIQQLPTWSSRSTMSERYTSARSCALFRSVPMPAMVTRFSMASPKSCHLQTRQQDLVGGAEGLQVLALCLRGCQLVREQLRLSSGVGLSRRLRGLELGSQRLDGSAMSLITAQECRCAKLSSIPFGGWIIRLSGGLAPSCSTVFVHCRLRGVRSNKRLAQRLVAPSANAAERGFHGNLSMMQTSRSCAHLAWKAVTPRSSPDWLPAERSSRHRPPAAAPS